MRNLYFIEMRNLYFIEITDTYGGEANYSWVTRHVIRAKSFRGAVNRMARLSGLAWRCVGDYGDSARYDSASGLTCCFVQDYDPAQHADYRLQTDDRS